MALWNGVGQVASIAQLAGVDAYGLISMIVEAAQTVKRNRETCQLLARRARMIGDLLQQLQSTQLMQHTETRNPVEQLEETLRHAYMLVASCQEGSYLHSCFMGGKQAEKLLEVQNEITFYLQLFPVVSFIDTTRTFERLMNRDHPSCSEGITDELNAVHRSEHGDRFRTGALEATDLEDPATHPCSKSKEELSLGKKYKQEHVGSQLHLIAANGAELSCFSFPQILAATKKFSHSNLVGEGAFGCIYRGKLSKGLHVAVKRHNSSALHGLREFRSEIEAIPNLRHKNIIALLGFCVQGEEMILVYEYMQNKCLASIIADEGKRKLLNWPKRLQIIQGIADGLAYMHGHSRMCFVHRDMKASNILLDHEMNAKITDFGLAVRLVQNMPLEVDLPICGTSVYIDPEYIVTGNISKRLDVYGFGIILLEIIGGKLSQSYMRKAQGTSIWLSLPEYARKYQKELHMIVDPLLDANEHERAQIKECVKVALLCISSHAELRPTMSEVVSRIGSIRTTV